MSESDPLGNAADSPAKSTGRKLTWLAILGFVGALVYFFITPDFVRDNSGGQLPACKANLKNIATALEMYATDNGGQYPATLSKLTDLFKGSPYLKTIPTCPSAGKETYIDYQVSTVPDSFSFSCCGNNHGAAYAGYGLKSDGFPKYSSENGLLAHP